MAALRKLWVWGLQDDLVKVLLSLAALAHSQKHMVEGEPTPTDCLLTYSCTVECVHPRTQVINVIKKKFLVGEHLLRLATRD